MGDNKQAATYADINAKEGDVRRRFILAALFASLPELSARRGPFPDSSAWETEQKWTPLPRVYGRASCGGVGTSGSHHRLPHHSDPEQRNELLAIDSSMQDIVKGIVILIAVTIDFLEKTK